MDKKYWEDRYQLKETGWDVGQITTPIKEYIDQLKNKDIKILIPGAGNSYEFDYLISKGFKNVFVIDIAHQPLLSIGERNPKLKSQLIEGDFFELNDTFDLIIEQTFFCALNPQLREKYAHKMFDILNNKGKIVGLLFNFPLTEVGPPFGGCEDEYISLFKEKFNIKTLENSYNSIIPRKDRELFFIFEKK